MKAFIFVLLTWLGLFATGCTKVKPPERVTALQDLFTVEASRGTQRLAPGQLEQDLAWLERLVADEAELQSDILGLKRQFLFRTNAEYFTEDDARHAQFLLRRVLNLRDRYSELTERYREAQCDDPDQQVQCGVMVLSAGVHFYAISTFLVSEFIEFAPLRKLLDAEYRRYEIPQHTFSDLLDEATNPEHIRSIQLLWQFAHRSRMKADAPLAHMLDQHPDYTALWDQSDRTFSDLWVRIHYSLMMSDRMAPELSNFFRHSSLGKAAEDLWQQWDRDVYQLRGSLFKNVARIKHPISPLTVFSSAQKEEIIQHLQPGDIVLTYTSGFMSNIFLPGSFKHGIMYVGPPGQRDPGLDDAFLQSFAHSDMQFQTLKERHAITTTAEGHRADVIEAISEGVIYSSLEHILDTHVSRLLVLRPTLDAAERRQALAETLAQLKAPYDFKFDFSEASHLCCTELIYRALHGKGDIDLSFTKTHGQWVLTADDLARYAIEHGPSAFTPILYAEADPEYADYRARVSVAEEVLPRLTPLLSAP